MASKLNFLIYLRSLMVVMVSMTLAASLSSEKVLGQEKGDINRVADVLEVRHIGDKKIRIFFSAQENNGVQRFPITTIDRAMVKVDFTNASAPPADEIGRAHV